MEKMETKQKIKEKTLGWQFFQYVSSNILGMMGLSFYILADTYFVAAKLGADGLAALNIAIPAYSIVNATGLMVAMGGGVRFSIYHSQGRDKESDQTFTATLLTGWIFSLLYILIGCFFAKEIAFLLGAKGHILPMTTDYLRMMLFFGIFFISNDMMLTFTRNDGAPQLAMLGMLCGSLGNVVLDYIFIFPLDMGLFGAALATGFSPIISMMIMSTRIWQRKNSFHFRKVKQFWRKGLDFCRLGVSAFVNEISSGVVLTVFNLLILGISGNTGVAAYGVIANIALVGMAIYTGISQGTQPLVSRYYGEGNHEATKTLYYYSLGAALLAGAVLTAVAWGFTEPLAAAFNQKGDPVMQTMAETGLRDYFPGFLFAGLNIVSAVYLGAIERAVPSFFIALCRGVIAIIFFAVLLSAFWGMTGIWLAFPVAEAVTLILTVVLVKRSKTRSPIL